MIQNAVIPDIVLMVNVKEQKDGKYHYLKPFGLSGYASGYDLTASATPRTALSWSPDKTAISLMPSWFNRSTVETATGVDGRDKLNQKWSFTLFKTFRTHSAWQPSNSEWYLYFE